MIKKIISGGQTGADRAALDVALKLGIPHGGWIPKGRTAEDGRLPDKYQLKEMTTTSYCDRTEENVIDSDGTLIISQGRLSGGSHYTRKMAEKHRRPWLHMDISKTSKFGAALRISTWIFKNGIEVLNVAGPRSSKDPQIYQITMDVLESLIYICHIDANMLYKMRSSSSWANPPRTVEDALEKLVSRLSLKDKVIVANMKKEKLASLHFSLRQYIENSFGLWAGNQELIESCCAVAEKDYLDGHDAAAVIIEELWKKLKETHRLRVVK